LKVTREKTENSQAFLTIEMEPDEVEESLEQSYRRLVKKANIPGFRKGKAPREILERYLGKESLLDDAIEHMLPEAYEKAIKEQAIEAIAQPHIELAQTEPVVFKVTVPLKPTVETGDYGNIRLESEPVKVTDEDINSTIEQLRHSYATWEPVERPVAPDDLVSMNVSSNVDGKPFINQKGAQYQVLANAPFPVPGFAEQLVGMKVDEEKDFELQLPADYPKADLAGKPARFKVKISEIKQEKLPELNDEFARQVESGLENFQALRERVSADLKAKLEDKANMDFEDRVVEAAIERATLEFPQVLVESEIDRMVEERARYWQSGGQGLDAYLQSINKTEEQLREELRPLAKKRVEGSLVLDEIAQKEKIEVDDSEIKTEIDSLTKNAGESKDELERLLDTPRSRESIKQRLIIRKTVQRLVEVAKGPAVVETAEVPAEKEDTDVQQG
jgi:trigger factor